MSCDGLCLDNPAPTHFLKVKDTTVLLLKDLPEQQDMLLHSQVQQVIIYAAITVNKGNKRKKMTTFRQTFYFSNTDKIRFNDSIQRNTKMRKTKGWSTVNVSNLQELNES